MGCVPSREDILVEARTWIDTPWQHQGRLKGVACDCAGLILGVGDNAGGLVLEITDAMYQKFARYGHQPLTHVMVQALAHWMIKLEHSSRALAGDVIYRRYGENPQHLAILTGPLLEPMSGVIHALARPSRRVVEQRTDQTWIGGAVHSAWRYPGVVDE